LVILIIIIIIIINTNAVAIIQNTGYIAVFPIYSNGCAVRSLIVRYEMLGFSAFLTYGNFHVKEMILWNAGDGADMSAYYIQEYNISKLLK
jgi:hypothetical protein